MEPSGSAECSHRLYSAEPHYPDAFQARHRSHCQPSPWLATAVARPIKVATKRIECHAFNQGLLLAV
jgi:hypothetical protein